MRRFKSWWQRTVTGTVAVFVAAALGLSVAQVEAQATGTVEGQVTRASTGLPLAGAQVALVGTNIGAQTDADGRFVLSNVPAGTQQIRVLMIGYAVGTVRFNVGPGATNSVNLELNTSILRLDEVVVTGTAGAARRREVGNSIAQVNVGDLQDPPQNVDQLLQARAPGVNVMQGAGMAGSGAQIRLRGAVSVSQSNQPLIYIDGIRVKNDGYFKNVPMVGYDGRSGNVAASPLNDINPADIERIEVIKGAAASTLYGTDGAAGVIQIFTKRGSTGAARWDFQMDQGFARLLPFGPETNPYVNMRPCSGSVSCWDQWTSDTVNGQCADIGADTQCSWLRDARRQKFSGSVSGGTERMGYYLSSSYQDNDGVLPLDNEAKVVTRGNFNFNVSDNVRVDFNTSYTNNQIRNTPAGNNAHGMTLNIFRSNRNYVQSSDPDKLRPLLNQEITTDIHRIITGGTVTYSPTERFTTRFTLGYDYANQENRNLRPFGFIRAPTGILSDQQVKFTTLTADYVGSYNFDLGESMRSTFSFGGQSVTTETIQTAAYGDDFAGPGVPTVDGAATWVARESRVRVVTAGFFLQDMLALQDRYFLTVGARFDGNSAFGKSLGIEMYPKASLSYVVSDESFFPESMGEMKLRAAVGWAGRAPGAFDAVRTWTAAAWANEPAFTPAVVGNDSLGPERTREIELGFDWGFLDNRISTEFTWYNQTTSDALFAVRQIPSDGFLGSQLANVGKIQNRGIEFAVNASVIDQPNLGLDLGFNVYTSHSLVLDLGGATPFGAGGGWVEEGFPVMVATGVKIHNPDAIAAPELDCLATDPCTDGGLYVFGPQQPTEVFGLNMMLRLPHDITLSARGEFQGGAYIFDGASNNALQRSVKWPTCDAAYNILDGGGTETDLTALQRMECIPANHTSQIHWVKQDFFKLRDVTARFPLSSLLSQARSATFTVTAQNWFRWLNDDMRIFDPEIQGNGGRTRSGFDAQNRSITEHIPSPAVLTASLRVSF